MVNNTFQLDRIFSALADPTRRTLLASLGKRGARVGELAAPLEMSLPAVSKHLKILEAAGLITRRIEGREHHIQLEATPLKNALDWIATYRHFWDNRLQALEKALGELELEKTGLEEKEK